MLASSPCHTPTTTAHTPVLLFWLQRCVWRAADRTPNPAWELRARATAAHPQAVWLTHSRELAQARDSALLGHPCQTLPQRACAGAAHQGKIPWPVKPNGTHTVVFLLCSAHKGWFYRRHYSIDSVALDLLDKLLALNPAHRISISDALNHEYFWDPPPPKPEEYIATANTSSICALLSAQDIYPCSVLALTDCPSLPSSRAMATKSRRCARNNTPLHSAKSRQPTNDMPNNSNNISNNNNNNSNISSNRHHNSNNHNNKLKVEMELAEELVLPLWTDISFKTIQTFIGKRPFVMRAAFSPVTCRNC